MASDARQKLCRHETARASGQHVRALRLRAMGVCKHVQQRVLTWVYAVAAPDKASSVAGGLLAGCTAAAATKS